MLWWRGLSTRAAACRHLRVICQQPPASQIRRQTAGRPPAARRPPAGQPSPHPAPARPSSSQAAEALRSIAITGQSERRGQSRASQEAVALSQAVVARANALASAVSALQPLDATAIGLATPLEFELEPQPQPQLQYRPQRERVQPASSPGEHPRRGSAGSGSAGGPGEGAAAGGVFALAEPGVWEAWLAAQLDAADETADAEVTATRAAASAATPAPAPEWQGHTRDRAPSHGSVARLRARAERLRLMESHVASAARERVAHESAAGHGSVRDTSGESALAELEGVTDGLLGTAGGISSALAEGTSRVEAVRAGVRANQRRADACIAELGQSNRSSWMALLNHLAALAAAVVAFVLTYMVIRVMPRGSL